MTIHRREFFGQVALGAVLTATPRTLEASVRVLEPHLPPPFPTSEWDVTWTKRITGRYRAVFDVPEIESGYGAWRATVWKRQYRDVLGAKPADLSSVVVLRHTGVALAMQQAYWDRYDIGRSKKVMHPITHEMTDRNPALLASSRNEVPAEVDEMALDRYLASGGIALACNLALQDLIDDAVKKTGMAAADARAEAVASLVPGVILQPSGVFAALYAQEFGCRYLRAS